MNVTRPSGVTARVAGLATSCSSAPNRSACPRVSSLASGSARNAPTARRVLAEPLLGVALERDRRARAPRACARTRRGGGRGSARPRAARSARAGPPRSRRARPSARSPSSAPSAITIRLQLGEHPLRRDLRRAPARSRAAAAPCRGSTAKPSSQASRASAQRPQRIVAEAPARTTIAQPPRAQVARARRTGRRSSPPPSGSAIALIVKSRRARSLSIVRPAQRQRCRPASARSRATTRQAPNASDSANACAPSQRAERARGRSRRRRRPPRRVVGRARPSSAVAHRAADQPGRLVRDRRASASQRIARGAHAGRSRRGGTRAAPAAEIPHSDLVVDRAEPPRQLLGGHALARRRRRSATARRPHRTASARCRASTVMLSMLTVPTSG